MTARTDHLTVSRNSTLVRLVQAKQALRRHRAGTRLEPFRLYQGAIDIKYNGFHRVISDTMEDSRQQSPDKINDSRAIRLVKVKANDTAPKRL